jgi:WD40 repeat protein
MPPLAKVTRAFVDSPSCLFFFEGKVKSRMSPFRLLTQLVLIMAAWDADGTSVISPAGLPEFRFVDPGTWFATFSHDGKFLVTAGGQDDKQGFIKFWRLENKKAVREAQRLDLPISAPVQVVALTGDNRMIASAWGGTMLFLESQRGKILERRDYDSIVQLSSCPTKPILAVRTWRGLVDILNLETMKSELTVRERVPDLCCVAIHPRGHRVLIANYSDDKLSLKEYEIETRTSVVKRMQTACNAPFASIFSPSTRMLAVGYPAEYEEELRRRYEEKSALSPAFSKAGHIKVWETDTGREIAHLQKHRNRVGALCFSPSERFLASGSHDGNVKIWNLKTSREIADYRGPKEGVIWSLSFSPDESLLAALCSGGEVRIWNLRLR